MSVTLALAPNKISNQRNNPQKLSKNRKDKESIRGAFLWLQISKYYIPSIVRVTNGENLRFVSVRMAETSLLKKYLPSLHSDLLEVGFVKFYLMTHYEAKLFNEINRVHSNNFYGENPFLTTDYIVRFEDIYEFYEFIEFCYTKLFYNIIPDSEEKCGFIRINFKSIVPYIMKDSIKYIPLFYFNSFDKKLTQQCVIIKEWSLAYLKFCCKVQSITADFCSRDFCKMINIDVIKHYFSPKTHFEEFWPDNFNKSQLINNDIEAKESGSWIRKPLVVVAPVTENTTTHNSKTSVIPHNIPVITKVQEMKENQMELLKIQKGSSIINNTVNVPQLPPTSTALSILNTERNSSIASEMIDFMSPPSSPASNNQEETVYTPISAVQFKRKSEQMLHSTSMNNAYKELSEKHQGNNTINSLVNVPQLPPPSPPPSTELSILNTGINSHITNEMIDLTSPPSSPAPNNQEETVYTPISAVQFKRKSEQMLHGTSKKNTYKELSEIHHGSSTINNTIYVPQLPSPPPAIPLFRVGTLETQDTDSQTVIPQSVTAIKNIHGIQANQKDLAIISQGSSLMNNMSYILQLPPPPPALPIFQVGQVETQNIE